VADAGSASSAESRTDIAAEGNSRAVDDTEAASASFPDGLLVLLPQRLFNRWVWALRSEWARVGHGVG
jgi:hypothetical protein